MTYLKELSSWDKYFIFLAHTISLKSKDPNTQCGHIIVNAEKSIISTGYNSYARGLNDDLLERKERPEKYYWIEHSERNSIYNAARHGIRLDGCTMYGTTPIPCCACARAIINAGIKTIYVKAQDEESWRDWKPEMERSRIMLEECEVEIYVYEYDLTKEYDLLRRRFQSD